MMLSRITLVAAVVFSSLPVTARAQDSTGGKPAPLPTIEAKTAGMRKLDGFFPLYWNADAGTLYMEVPRLDTDVLDMDGLASGLGSNDIGLDRGAVTGERMVRFERIGRKVLMVQPNLNYRSLSRDSAEIADVHDAFAPSVLWGFPLAAASDGGRRVLVEMNDYLLHDPAEIAQRLGPGSYKLEADRSAISMPMTENFPENTEMEAELTFVRQSGGHGNTGGGMAYFQGVGAVSATPDAATLRLHHSFIQLPDTSGFTPRTYDPSSGYGPFSWQDYSAPLGQSLTQRFITRHRLAKRDPTAEMSDPVKPIIYYIDPGTPEPMRSALLEGAGWWNQAFTAAGYRNAFQVKLLPPGASPLDIRYNIIDWVNRSTRGWSYGGGVIDPRTGEILKGVVTLGSLRVRQDWLIAEGLLQPYQNGTEQAPEIQAWVLQRLKQLAAHETGHSLGLDHNYYDSDSGRISVMDYPAPLLTLRADGTLDISKVYADGIGAWDKVSIAYGYQDFPAGTNVSRALDAILDTAYAHDLRYQTNQDIDVNPRADQWSNGTEPAAELDRIMAIRASALRTFGVNAIKLRTPLAQIEEALVPLYMYHRYQAEAAASALGGIHYTYALRGDGREAFRRATAREQNAALSALMRVLRPSALALPDTLLRIIPPRPEGYDATRELFPRNTGPAFDDVTPAVVAAQHVVGTILSSERATRLVEQHALDPALPGLDAVIDTVVATAFDAPVAGPYQAAIKRAIERVVVDQLLSLAGNAPMADVRALANYALQQRATVLTRRVAMGDVAARANATLLAEDIHRFMSRPAGTVSPVAQPDVPPGAPIGEPALDWLGRLPAERPAGGYWQ
ncbi:MAG: zinc-dependent metalloprotease [Gemmatimonadales bacterium]